MPEWLHQRAEHILAKNPSMPKSEAFAIATQQGHAVEKNPKGYGTAEGKATAKAKYDTPKDDDKTANPGHLKSPKMEKKSYMERLLPGTEGYYGERMREVLMGLAPRVYTPFGVEHTKLASCLDELQKIATEKDSGWIDSIGQAMGKINRGGSMTGGVSGKGPSADFLKFQQQNAAKQAIKPKLPSN